MTSTAYKTKFYSIYSLYHRLISINNWLSDVSAIKTVNRYKLKFNFYSYSKAPRER